MGYDGPVTEGSPAMPARFAPYLFAFLLSGFMSPLVAGIATAKNLGFPPNFLSLWAFSWMSAWAVSFPVVMVVAPMVRWIVAKVVKEP